MVIRKKTAERNPLLVTNRLLFRKFNPDEKTWIDILKYPYRLDDKGVNYPNLRNSLRHAPFFEESPTGYYVQCQYS
ncbi:hypothetical protein SAMN05444392_12517 [Seinonella peptonophila]|uniref:Uncharacterized protein n=1 Tax=Seinonella peptonophila TaxID=112248 RepID=A0A1M5BKS3_9BACL|nr:hypothetical protein SAMN05444392_12517 [Seinonella peptonophila]